MMCRNLLGHSQVCHMLVTLKQESEPGVNSINSNCWERECLQEPTNLHNNVYLYAPYATDCIYMYYIYVYVYV